MDLRIVPSDGETGAPPVVVPADLRASERPTTADRRRLENWLAIAAAALLHALVILWFAFSWRITLPPQEPEALPVQLVMAPPAPPNPAAPDHRYRESGKDEETTAPPPAESPGPETTPPEPSEPASAVTSPEHRPIDETKPKPRQEAMRVPPRKEAEISHAPRPAAPQSIEMAPGDKYLSGDPYLNLLTKIIARHWIVPKAASQFGLPVTGIAVFTLIIDARGNLTSVTLTQSSGVAVLDQAAERMIRESAPFPPPPADFPGISWPLRWEISLYSELP